MLTDWPANNMELFKELSNQGGILGTLLAISLLAIVWLTKMLLAEKDKRIEEAIKTRDTVIEPISYIKDSLSIIKDKILVSKEAQK